MLKNIQNIISNQTVQRTVAGISGFIAGRLYPTVKDKLHAGIVSLKERINRFKIASS